MVLHWLSILEADACFDFTAEVTHYQIDLSMSSQTTKSMSILQAASPKRSTEEAKQMEMYGFYISLQCR